MASGSPSEDDTVPRGVELVGHADTADGYGGESKRPVSAVLPEWHSVKCSDRILVRSLDALPDRQVPNLSTKSAESMGG
jgi:hypothetical protein